MPKLNVKSEDLDRKALVRFYQRLEDKGAKFLKLRPNLKVPVSTWKDTANHIPPFDAALYSGKKFNTGVYAGKKIVVLDADNLDAEDWLRNQVGESPIVRTPRGIHVYFLTDIEIGGSAANIFGNAPKTDMLPQGIDIKTGDAYLVGPGSVLTKEAYKGGTKPKGKEPWHYALENTAKIRMIPEKLAELVRKYRGKDFAGVTVSESKGSGLGKKAVENQWGYIQSLNPVEGTRNKTLSDECLKLGKECAYAFLQGDFGSNDRHHWQARAHNWAEEFGGDPGARKSAETAFNKGYDQRIRKGLNKPTSAPSKPNKKLPTDNPEPLDIWMNESHTQEAEKPIIYKEEKYLIDPVEKEGDDPEEPNAQSVFGGPR